ncbi:MAG: hypothetical protein U0361_22920 [Nitrospiraceae bacterium]
MTIEELHLHPVMEQACRQFEWAFANVQWLSGRRDREGQARAMAGHVLRDRQWISKTYLHAAHLQTAVDFHPEAQTLEQLSTLLHHTMLGMSDEELAKVSDHIGGMAVDLVPMIFGDGDPTPTGKAALKWMHDYPYTKRVLTREGGRIVWHWACQEHPRPSRGTALA